MEKKEREKRDTLHDLSKEKKTLCSRLIPLAIARQKRANESEQWGGSGNTCWLSSSSPFLSRIATLSLFVSLSHIHTYSRSSYLLTISLFFVSIRLAFCEISLFTFDVSSDYSTTLFGKNQSLPLHCTSKEKGGAPPLYLLQQFLEFFLLRGVGGEGTAEKALLPGKPFLFVDPILPHKRNPTPLHVNNTRTASLLSPPRLVVLVLVLVWEIQSKAKQRIDS